MGLEIIDDNSTPEDLDSQWPLAEDPVKMGDNHLRNIKKVMQNEYRRSYGVVGENLLINGDFSVWQRGTSFSIGPGAYTADHWLVQPANGEVTSVNKVDNAYIQELGRVNALKVVRGNLSGSLYAVRQPVEGGLSRLYRKNATLSFYLYSSKAGTYLTRLYNAETNSDVNVEGGYPTVDVLANTWTKVVVNFKDIGLNLTTSQVNDSNKHLLVYVLANIGDVLTSQGDFLMVTGVKLEAGLVSTPFVPDSPAVNLAKCQRYYFKGSGFAVDYVNTVDRFFIKDLPTEMRIKPSVSYVLSAGTFQQDYSSTDRIQLFIKSSAVTTGLRVDFEADAEL